MYFWRTEGRIVSFATGHAGSCTLAFCRLQYASSDDSESACIALKSRRLSFQKARGHLRQGWNSLGWLTVCPHDIHQEQTVFQGVSDACTDSSGSFVVEVFSGAAPGFCPKGSPCLAYDVEATQQDIRPRCGQHDANSSFHSTIHTADDRTGCTDGESIAGLAEMPFPGARPAAAISSALY